MEGDSYKFGSVNLKKLSDLVSSLSEDACRELLIISQNLLGCEHNLAYDLEDLGILPPALARKTSDYFFPIMFEAKPKTASGASRCRFDDNDPRSIALAMLNGFDYDNQFMLDNLLKVDRSKCGITPKICEYDDGADIASKHERDATFMDAVSSGVSKHSILRKVSASDICGDEGVVGGARYNASTLIESFVLETSFRELLLDIINASVSNVEEQIFSETVAFVLTGKPTLSRLEGKFGTLDSHQLFLMRDSGDISQETYRLARSAANVSEFYRRSGVLGTLNEKNLLP